LNDLVARRAADLDIAFLDLHPVFAADWARARRRFDFGEADNHWNAHAHAVAAEAIRERLRALGGPCADPKRADPWAGGGGREGRRR
jgi:hypothetical protein